MKRIPYIPQLHKTECGICTVAMVLAFYGAHNSMHEIRQKAIISRDGLSIRDLIEIFDYFGVSAEPYKCKTIRTIEDYQFPVIVTVNSNHYVIVEKIKHGYVLYTDPAVGHEKKYR